MPTKHTNSLAFGLQRKLTATMDKYAEFKLRQHAAARNMVKLAQVAEGKRLPVVTPRMTPPTIIRVRLMTFQQFQPLPGVHFFFVKGLLDHRQNKQLISIDMHGPLTPSVLN